MPTDVRFNSQQYFRAGDTDVQDSIVAESSWLSGRTALTRLFHEAVRDVKAQSSKSLACPCANVVRLT